MIEYSGARIQLLDLPGIVEGASQGVHSNISSYKTYLDLIPFQDVDVDDKWYQVGKIILI